MKKQIVLLMVLLVAGTASAAVQINPALDNTFSVTGPAAIFTDWATSNGATTVGSWGTYLASGFMVSGSTQADYGAALHIPFTSSAAFESVIIGHSSQVLSYGSNWGMCKMYVTVNGSDTLIFANYSPDYNNPALNYNYNGPAVVPGEFNKLTTDISDLVAGYTEFTLVLYSQLGWSGYYFNGGVFMNATHGTDLTVTGTVVPEPMTVVLLATGLIGAVIRRRK